ncbi:hypothetical protein CGK10_17600 [Vibrio parahaemolyticus]|nr:hypothetical protein CGK10_17600 [Vibrio parahaemolyticus]
MLSRGPKSSNFGQLHNAALSGEQRRPPQLNHCAVNTKVESNQKCQALGIRLKRFVRRQLRKARFHPYRYRLSQVLFQVR